MPEGLERAFYEDISRGLGLDPARSCWLASDARPLATARAFGGRAGMWLEKGRGLPEGTLAGSLVPGICAPDFQGALDWAGASR
ncbi:MAG: hypothetical protein LBQ12_15905 [Deltaproteobacteria bacterium]|nr:hypothetical protein [Deltaproteobacteria bacterium]